MGEISFITLKLEKPYPNRNSLIHWTETTYIEPKQYMEIIEGTEWRKSSAVNF